MEPVDRGRACNVSPCGHGCHCGCRECRESGPAGTALPQGSMASGTGPEHCDPGQAGPHRHGGKRRSAASPRAADLRRAEAGAGRGQRGRPCMIPGVTGARTGQIEIHAQITRHTKGAGNAMLAAMPSALSAAGTMSSTLWRLRNCARRHGRRNQATMRRVRQGPVSPGYTQA